MKRLIRFSVQYPAVVLAVYLVLALLGIRGALLLPLDAVPDVSNNQVRVNTQVEGLSPEQIEKQVTLPLEAALSGVPGTLEIRSLSRPRLSQITIVFEDHTDPYRARQMVSERLQTVREDLPPGSSPSLGPLTTGLGDIVFYRVDFSETAKDPAERRAQLMDLVVLNQRVIKPRLLRVRGVADVSLNGGYERQLVIEPSPDRLARRGVHFDDLGEAVEMALRPAGGGILERGGEQFPVAVRGGLESPLSIGKIPVKSDLSLAGVRVSDVANVSWGHAPRTGASTVDGQESLVVTVLMAAGENGRAVARAVADKLDDLRVDLPKGVVLEALYDRADFVEMVLGTVGHNLAYGAILVLVVLLLLLGNTRAALITAVTLPASMLFALVFLERWGVSGNLMSLGALDFGLLVDGTVIVIDHCVRRLTDLQQRLGRTPTPVEVKETVAVATEEVRTSAGFGELVLVVALLPLYGLTGVEAKTFTPMVTVLGLGILGAFLFSFTGAPALAGFFLSKGSTDHEPGLMRATRRRYAPMLEKTLAHPKILLMAAGLLVVLGGLMYAKLGAVFMPRLDEGSLVIQFMRPPGIALEQSLELQSISEKVILEFPQIARVYGRLGTPEIATDPMGVNVADTYVILKKVKDWPKDGPRTKEALVEAVSDRLRKEVPGQRLLATQPIEMRFNEILEGIQAEVGIKVFGADLESMSQTADAIADVIRKIPGAGDVELETQGTAPILSVEPKWDVLTNLGVPSSELMDTIGTGLAGREVGRVFPGSGWPVDAVVRLEESNRRDLEVLKRLPVGIGSMDTRPLGDLADFRFLQAYPSVFREMGQRRVAILVNTQGGDLEGFVKAARQKVRDEVKLPPGTYLDWGGTFENLQNARARLAILSPLALALVFLMVFAAFRDWAFSVLVFAGVPLALFGGLVALSLRGLPFSISAAVGFIALAGIAVLNGMVLTSTFVQLRKDGQAAAEAVRNAALGRLRPVLMTALVEIFGFLPMMFSTGMGAEVQRPLATVVVGGVFSATFLTLLTLPAWQLWIEKRRERKAAG